MGRKYQKRLTSEQDGAQFLGSGAGQFPHWAGKMGNVPSVPEFPSAQVYTMTAPAMNVMGGIFLAEMAVLPGVGEIAEAGLPDLWIDVTAPSAQVLNLATNISAEDYLADLEANGYNVRTSGNATLYTDAEGNYFVYRPSDSTGIAIDYYSTSGTEVTIRFTIP